MPATACLADYSADSSVLSKCLSLVRLRGRAGQHLIKAPVPWPASSTTDLNLVLFDFGTT